MNTTSLIAFLITALICVVMGLLFATKSGKRVRLRMSGTADEMISKDASTPEGAKAYYNVAIEKKNNDVIQARTVYSQMLGKISNFDDQLRSLKKDAMRVKLDIQSCIDKNDDDGARIYLKKQQDIEEKMEIIKNALEELKENASLQKETLETLETELEDLKAEKDNAVLTLETAQVTNCRQQSVLLIRKKIKCLKRYVTELRSKKKKLMELKLLMKTPHRYNSSGLIKK